MPFDGAADPAPIVQVVEQEAERAGAGAPDATWALANPDHALAFLFLAPQPC